MNDDLDAVVERDERRVGDDARDLDDHVGLDVETGHLQVDPHQAIVDARLCRRCRHAAHDIRLRVTGRFPPVTALPAAWRPDAELLAESNVARFMAAEHIDDFAELVARSIDDPEWFWDAVVRFLGIRFSTPYERVLDTSDGIPWAKWFTGGTLNIAETCIDKWAPSDSVSGRLGRRGRRRPAS